MHIRSIAMIMQLKPINHQFYNMQKLAGTAIKRALERPEINPARAIQSSNRYVRMYTETGAFCTNVHNKRVIRNKMFCTNVHRNELT